jgi:cytoskeletal protein RodZ
MLAATAAPSRRAVGTVPAMFKTLLGALALATILTGCASDSGSDDSAASQSTDSTTAASTVTSTATSSSSPNAPATTATTTDTDTDEQKYPDIVDATMSQDADGTWTVAVTLSSPYDTAERYADGWRVLDLDGNIIGDRPLAHDHAGEQPFTRSTNGVAIPEGASEVVIEARDQKYGWGPDRLTVQVP